MKKKSIFLLVALIFFSAAVGVYAQVPGEEAVEASKSMEASEAAQVVKTENTSDLTQIQGPAKSKLEKLLEDQKLGRADATNFLRYAIHDAVGKGVPVNTVVLMLLFPLVAAIIAASRHLIGLRGFGIFTPAAVAVGFLATGLTTGLLLFALILFIASVGRVGIKRLRLLYLPKVSLLLWLVSLGVLLLLLFSPYLSVLNLAELSIFPTLVLVLLAEEFINVQTKQGMRAAAQMTAETLILATVSYLVMTLQSVQKFVLLNPEITIAGVGFFNVFLGKFIGLRLVEYFRFKDILR